MLIFLVFLLLSFEILTASQSFVIICIDAATESFPFILFICLSIFTHNNSWNVNQKICNENLYTPVNKEK